jgi:hypothetical protein
MLFPATIQFVGAHAKRLLALHRIFFAVILAAAMTICGVGQARADSRPAWVNTGLPSSVSPRAFKAEIRVVGVATDAASYEEAMEKAWINGLSMMAKTHFPFLIDIREESRETLRSTEFKRDTRLHITNIQWDGLEEDTQAGSPYFEASPGPDGETRYRAWRLLKWSRAAVSAERKRLLDIARAGRGALAANSVYTSVVGRRDVATGTLRIATEPAGAALVLDGEFIGRSNAEFQAVGAGSYQLVVSLDGYDVHEEKITIGAGRQSDFRVKLARSRGKIKIDSTPSNAIVYVDNIPGGRNTPFEMELEEGTHSILVEVPGFYPDRRTIVVEARRSRNIDVNLVAKPGRLSVLTRPAKAVVYVDGEKIGESDILNRIVKGGQRMVRVEKEGFAAVEEKVSVNELMGKSLVINLTESPSWNRGGRYVPRSNDVPEISSSGRSRDYYGRDNRPGADLKPEFSSTSSYPAASKRSALFFLALGLGLAGMSEMSSAGSPPEEEYECTGSGSSRSCDWVTKDNGHDQGAMDRAGILLGLSGMITIFAVID